MDQTTAVVIVVALVVFAVITVFVLRQKRTTELRRQFGPEYDRLVQEKGSAGRAEAELSSRTKRVERLSIQPLPPDRRRRYAERWKEQQARFVDEPKAAIDDADHLVEEVMKERGYPVGAFDQKVADISVDHPRVVERYRAAHEIAERERRGQASTEDLRQAMIYYRDLFVELLEEPILEGAPSR